MNYLIGYIAKSPLSAKIDSIFIRNVDSMPSGNFLIDRVFAHHPNNPDITILAISPLSDDDLKNLLL